jgi:hypothetical protein
MDFFRRRQDENPQAPDALTDEQAIQRYRYLLATAPPDDIERAHEEAFARLTPEQRRQALQALAQHVPDGEVRGDDPASLARTATRAEMREPGTIERAWGPGGGGAGFGLGSFFLSTLAGSFIGTAIAQQLFANDLAATGEAGGAGADESGGSDGGSGDGGDFGTSDGGDFGGGDLGGGDFGDFGGF